MFTKGSLFLKSLFYGYPYAIFKLKHITQDPNTKQDIRYNTAIRKSEFTSGAL